MTQHRQASIGVLSWLAMIGDTHNRLTTGEFMKQLNASRNSGKLELICLGNQPMAWLVWRQLSLQAWQQLLDTHRLSTPSHSHPEPTALLGNVWLDFWVRPFGCDEKMANAVKQLLDQKGLNAEGLSWYDPSVGEGKGALHLNVPWHALEGM